MSSEWCPEKVNRLFDNWEETLIWSALQGVMGEVYVAELSNPVSAMIIQGDFCFLAGLGCEKLLLNNNALFSKGFVIMVPQNKEWEKIIEEVYGEKAKPVVRYALKKETDIFDRLYLSELITGIAEEYELKMIDKDIYHQCKGNKWSADLVSQFKNYEEYRKLGLGAVILKSGEVVAGASSYSRYKGGIEIEIDTRKDYRRRGLATVCGAKLILECLERGLYPGWDAQNLWSLALAEKLGYHFSHEYRAYEVVFP